MRPEFAVQTPETVPEWSENTSESIIAFTSAGFRVPCSKQAPRFQKGNNGVNSVGFCGTKYPGPPQTYPYGGGPPTGGN